MNSEASLADLDAGLVGAPGAQQLGHGLSLMVTSTQAFFLQPQLSTNYRYNIHVPSNGSVIFVDAPLPGSVVAIRKDLRGDEMLQVSLDVAGTMLSVIAVSSEDWKVESSSIQAAVLERLGWSARNLANTTAPLFPGNLALMLTKRNHTYTCVSVWGGDEKSKMAVQSIV